MEKSNGILVSVTDEDLNQLGSLPDGYSLLWKDVVKIGEGAFDKCNSIQVLKIPNTVKHIEKFSISKCKNLKKIILPESLTDIENFAISECENLAEIQIPNNTKLTVFPSIYGYNRLTKIDLPENIKTVNIPKTLSSIKYVTVTLNGKKLTVPAKLFVQFNQEINYCSFLQKANTTYFNRYFNIEDKNCPLYLENENPNVKVLCRKKEVTPFSQNEYYTLFYLANELGCFSNDKINIQQGTQTAQISLAEKASETLSHLIKNFLIFPENRKILNFIDSNHELKNYNSSLEDFKPSINFYKFLTANDNNYSNFRTFLNYYNKANLSDVRIRSIINKFDFILQYKKENKSSWEKAFDVYLTRLAGKELNDRYGVYDELNKNNLLITNSQYKRLLGIVEKQHKENIPHHITSKPLSGGDKVVELDAKNYDYDSSLRRIYAIQKQINEQLKNGEDNIVLVHEMLDKYDIKNAFIGKYKNDLNDPDSGFDCCAYLESGYNGQTIAKKSMLDSCVQNMIVKDKKTNNILAKAALYVNKQEGYILINTFSLINSFDKFVPSNAKDNVFNTFLLGINNLVETYNSDPKNTVKIYQVNVGDSIFNDLHFSCVRSELNKVLQGQSKHLKAPKEYEFDDSNYDNQFILYYNPKTKKQNQEIKNQTNVSTQQKVQNSTTNKTK